MVKTKTLFNEYISEGKNGINQKPVLRGEKWHEPGPCIERVKRHVLRAYLVTKYS